MPYVTVDLSNVDWTLLREQKQSLLRVLETITKTVTPEEARAKTGATETTDHLRGLVHLLDHIQDQAAETLGEKVVFGKRRA